MANYNGLLEDYSHYERLSTRKLESHVVSSDDFNRIIFLHGGHKAHNIKRLLLPSERLRQEFGDNVKE
jgi:hypothetical protein